METARIMDMEKNINDEYAAAVALEIIINNMPAFPPEDFREAASYIVGHLRDQIEEIREIYRQAYETDSQPDDAT